MAAFKLKNLRSVTALKQLEKELPSAGNPVVGGIPNVNLVDTGIVSGLKMRKQLIENSTLNTENLAPTSKNLSTECLGSLCISVEVDTNPEFSFLTDSTDSDSYNTKTKEKAKDDGSSMFPENNDPWHEHDESPSIGEKQLLDAQSARAHDIQPQALMDTIYRVNNKLGDTVKLTQLRQRKY